MATSARWMAWVGLALVWLGLCLYVALPRYTDASGYRRAAQDAAAPASMQPVTMPWMFHGAGRDFRLELGLDVTALTPRRWNVVCDDRLRELRVDGELVPLEHIPRAQRDDHTRGFDIDLSQWLQPGHHTLAFLFDNRTGGAGIQLNPQLGPLWGLVWLGFLPWMLVLGRAFRLSRGQLVVLAAALAVLCLYWSKTPWSLRGHDVEAHLDYFRYLMRHRRVPPPNGGWAFFHPPLYYLGGAALMWLGQVWQLTGLQLLQAFSLLLWLTFLLASAGALTLTLGAERRTRSARLAATVGVALWPVGLLHSVRLGNDAMLYALSALATYFLVAWWRAGRRSQLVCAALCIGLTMVAKSSGAVLIAAAGLLFVLRTTKQGAWARRATWIDAGLGAALLAAGVLACFGNGIYHYSKGTIPNWLVANANQLSDALKVPNNAKSLLVIDLPTFLTEPYLHVFRDETGRGNFWNALWRTGLVGEWEYQSKVLAGLSLGMGALLTAMLLGLLKPAWRLWRSPRRRWAALPWLVLAFGWIASVFVLRVQIPYACSNNFRYVLPVIVPLSLACAQSSRLHRVLLWLLGLCGVVFVVCLP